MFASIEHVKRCARASAMVKILRCWLGAQFLHDMDGMSQRDKREESVVAEFLKDHRRAALFTIFPAPCHDVEVTA